MNSSLTGNDDTDMTLSESTAGEHLSEDIDQLFELTRIIVMVLSGLLPHLSESNTHVPRRELSDDAISLIRLSLDALVDTASIFPSVIKTDLHACIIHIFASTCSQRCPPRPRWPVSANPSLTVSDPRYSLLPGASRASISPHIQTLHPRHRSLQRLVL